MKLKINHYFLFAFLSIVFVSCSSDDSELDISNDGAEQIAIEPGTVINNLIVEGGTKKAGSPTTPNEAISFNLDKDDTSALQTEGFDIKLNSNDNISGVYLQIKGNGGIVADGFYDIDLTQVGFKSKLETDKTKKSSFKRKKLRTKSSIEEQISIDVDFTNTIEAGTFCYVVCVYDEQGNISAPQEVCVTVESWGGNDDLVGVWNFTKEETIEDGQIITINVGEDNCYNDVITCSNQNQLEYSDCYVTNSIKLTVNSNGTYIIEIEETDEDLDYTASIEACEIIKDSSDETYITKGNWAYDQEKREIILVELEYSETEDGETEIETYDEGNAYVSRLEVNLSGDSLILIEDYTEEANNEEEYFKYFFIRQ